ncbi:MAG: lipoyl(octanoyl) transferase LipB, partial [Flavobacteriaceae bacterium]|nr:lipoyl(octanoyl) transferase LipB [Flavobacteriaceae bacterium]
RLGYREAYDLQCAHVEEVLASRLAGRPQPGFVLFVEHDPVITLSRRASASDHLLASEADLRADGIALEHTDRGGDITYHGPGQLVAYPILDLEHLRFRLHDYMRFLETVVIRVCDAWDLETRRDPCATGVWVGDAKICAMGVRVRRWISMHGLALNVTTDLDHFRHIVPCGLHGRTVTSLQKE